MKRSLVERGSFERLLLLAGALRSGLIDALASGEALSAEGVAGAAGADPRATRLVLEALTSEAVVERSVGTDGGALYSLSEEAKAHLVDEGPQLERSSLLFEADRVRHWLELAEVIRTGKPPARPRPDKRREGGLASAMGERDPAALDEIVERCFAFAGEIRTMLDVGGAVGHVARRFARRGVSATLLDSEDVLVLAKRFLGDEAAGIVLISCDYTESLPPGPFDLVYFGNVFHIYGPETNAGVARAAFKVTSPGGTVAIQDLLWERSAESAMFAINMLQTTVDGGVWTGADYRQWLSDAGFVDIQMLDLETGWGQLVLARRPGAGSPEVY